jgi:DNA repair exonuclease SbcCD nuclease subunit
MKFIHTSDWQLGMSFGHVPAKAEALRRARTDAVKQIMALAEREKVDFVIAAGDLLDGNRINIQTVEDMAAAMRLSPVPIFLLSGNHDPLTEDSPYIRFPQLFDSPVVVLRAAEPLRVAGGTLFPCPTFLRKSNEDPTKWIPPRHPEDGIRIGIAHGSMGTPAPNDFPIDAKAAQIHELDYLALGHWHSAKEIDPRTWYCGAPEATSFGEPNAGKVLLVEIAAPEVLPKVRAVDVASYKWKAIERELHTAEEAEAFRQEIQAMGHPQTLLSLRLKGTLPQEQLTAIENINGDKFFHVKREIDIALSTETLQYRHALLKGMAESLQKKTTVAGSEGASARRALSKLRLFVKQAGFRNEDS